MRRAETYLNNFHFHRSIRWERERDFAEISTVTHRRVLLDVSLHFIKSVLEYQQFRVGKALFFAISFYHRLHTAREAVKKKWPGLIFIELFFLIKNVIFFVIQGLSLARGPSMKFLRMQRCSPFEVSHKSSSGWRWHCWIVLLIECGW